MMALQAKRCPCNFYPAEEEEDGSILRKLLVDVIMDFQEESK